MRGVPPLMGGEAACWGWAARLVWTAWLRMTSRCCWLSVAWRVPAPQPPFTAGARVWAGRHACLGTVTRCMTLAACSWMMTGGLPGVTAARQPRGCHCLYRRPVPTARRAAQAPFLRCRCRSHSGAHHRRLPPTRMTPVVLHPRRRWGNRSPRRTRCPSPCRCRHTCATRGHSVSATLAWRHPWCAGAAAAAPPAGSAAAAAAGVPVAVQGGVAAAVGAPARAAAVAPATAPSPCMLLPNLPRQTVAQQRQQQR